MPGLAYRTFDGLLAASFYAIFFAVPFIFTPWNFELFEFNKMLLTYALTVVIVSAWAAKSILSGKLLFRRTLFDLPLLLFLLSQIISTLVSIDPHTSLWGYYTRSHGGLLSTITYLLLYWAFVSNFDKRKTQNAKRYLLTSALIVSVWGILEHFGASPSCLILTGSFDASCWIQDVQNRVFATLGQPNWMAAWLVVLVPLSWALVLEWKSGRAGEQESKIKLLLLYSFTLILFLALLFTKSRSGLLGFTTSFLVFWGITFLIHNSKFLIRPFLLLVTCYMLLVTISGTPWTPGMLGQRTKDLGQKVETGTVLERGGTESGEIRKIVWKGAIDIWKAYPLFGSGVETFAYSYYNFRPVEHNLTSEWNFLYNKAHNEYLNFLATTGAFGLGTYLFLIAAFLWWSFSNIKNKTAELSSISYQKLNIKNTDKNLKNFDIFNCHFNIYILHFALLAGFAGILVTNFFGFSVVPVALLFFLYPAMLVAGLRTKDPELRELKKIGIKQIILIAFVLCSMSYVLLRIGQFWYADTLFAKADKEIKTGETETSIGKLEQAISLNLGEPNYHDKLATAYSTLAATFAEKSDKQKAQEYADLAKQETDKAYAISPRNISLLKSRASTFNRLASVDETYLIYTLITLERAVTLAPTDPVINYNFAIALFRTGDTNRAIETLEKLNGVKPDYADSRFALAEIYILENRKEEAKKELEYILKNIDPNNEPVKTMIEKLSK